jgi:hypothetical protein
MELSNVTNDIQNYNESYYTYELFAVRSYTFLNSADGIFSGLFALYYCQNLWLNFLKDNKAFTSTQELGTSQR